METRKESLVDWFIYSAEGKIVGHIFRDRGFYRVRIIDAFTGKLEPMENAYACVSFKDAKYFIQRIHAKQ